MFATARTVRHGQDDHHHGGHPGSALAPYETRHGPVEDEDGRAQHYPYHVVVGDVGHITRTHCDEDVAAEQDQDRSQYYAEDEGEEDRLHRALGGFLPGTGTYEPGDDRCPTDTESRSETCDDLVKWRAYGGGGERIGTQSGAPRPVREGVDLYDQQGDQQWNGHRPDGLLRVPHQHGHVPFRGHASDIALLMIIASVGSYS